MGQRPNYSYIFFVAKPDVEIREQRWSAVLSILSEICFGKVHFIIEVSYPFELMKVHRIDVHRFLHLQISKKSNILWIGFIAGCASVIYVDSFSPAYIFNKHWRKYYQFIIFLYKYIQYNGIMWTIIQYKTYLLQKYKPEYKNT